MRFKSRKEQSRYFIRLVQVHRLLDIQFFKQREGNLTLKFAIWSLVSIYLFLPNDKILDWSKFKAFADDKKNDIQMIEICIREGENSVRKGENVGFQHFLLFPHVFKRLPPYCCIKELIGKGL